MTLNDLMEFDHVVYSDGEGNVDPAPDVWAPNAYTDCDAEGSLLSLDPADIKVTEPWSLLTGFSGQDGYAGPLMHDSEYVGGALERHIRENRAFYAVITVTAIGADDPDDDCAGWAVAYKEA